MPLLKVLSLTFTKMAPKRKIVATIKEEERLAAAAAKEAAAQRREALLLLEEEERLAAAAAREAAAEAQLREIERELSEEKIRELEEELRAQRLAAQSPYKSILPPGGPPPAPLQGPASRTTKLTHAKSVAGTKTGTQDHALGPEVVERGGRSGTTSVPVPMTRVEEKQAANAAKAAASAAASAAISAAKAKAAEEAATVRTRAAASKQAAEAEKARAKAEAKAQKVAQKAAAQAPKKAPKMTQEVNPVAATSKEEERLAAAAAKEAAAQRREALLLLEEEERLAAAAAREAAAEAQLREIERELSEEKIRELEEELRAQRLAAPSPSGYVLPAVAAAKGAREKAAAEKPVVEKAAAEKAAAEKAEKAAAAKEAAKTSHAGVGLVVKPEERLTGASPSAMKEAAAEAQLRRIEIELGTEKMRELEKALGLERLLELGAEMEPEPEPTPAKVKEEVVKLKPTAAGTAAPADSTTHGFHPNYKCDRSGVSPIKGIRYHLRGQNYDICQAEYDKLRTEEQKLYLAIPPPSSGGGSELLGELKRAQGGQKGSYVFTADGAADVSEQLGVKLSAGDFLTVPLLDAIREEMQVPSSTSNDQLKDALRSQGFLERTSAAAPQSREDMNARKGAEDPAAKGGRENEATIDQSENAAFFAPAFTKATGKTPSCVPSCEASCEPSKTAGAEKTTAEKAATAEKVAAEKAAAEKAGAEKAAAETAVKVAIDKKARETATAELAAENARASKAIGHRSKNRSKKMTSPEGQRKAPRAGEAAKEETTESVKAKMGPQNDEGAPVALGTDEFAATRHDGRTTIYCGRKFVRDARLSPRCGPTCGPACASCERFLASLVNDEGDAVAFGTSDGWRETLYCGRHKGLSEIPGSDGTCGPEDGPSCHSCRRLLSELTPPYWYKNSRHITGIDVDGTGAAFPAALLPEEGTFPYHEADANQIEKAIAELRAMHLPRPPRAPAPPKAAESRLHGRWLLDTIVPSYFRSSVDTAPVAPVASSSSRPRRLEGGRLEGGRLVDGRLEGTVVQSETDEDDVEQRMIALGVSPSKAAIPLPREVGYLPIADRPGGNAVDSWLLDVASNFDGQLDVNKLFGTLCCAHRKDPIDIIIPSTPAKGSPAMITTKLEEPQPGPLPPQPGPPPPGPPPPGPPPSSGRPVRRWLQSRPRPVRRLAQPSRSPIG